LEVWGEATRARADACTAGPLEGAEAIRTGADTGRQAACIEDEVVLLVAVRLTSGEGGVHALARPMRCGEQLHKFGASASGGNLEPLLPSSLFGAATYPVEHLLGEWTHCRATPISAMVVIGCWKADCCEDWCDDESGATASASVLCLTDGVFNVAQQTAFSRASIRFFMSSISACAILQSSMQADMAASISIRAILQFSTQSDVLAC